MTTNIEKYNLQKETINMKAQGYPLRIIANRLTKQSGVNIDYQSVRNFLNKKAETMTKVIEKSDKLQVQETERAFKVLEQMSWINTEMREYFIKLKAEDAQPKTVIYCAEHILKQLKMLMELEGMFHRAPSKQVINVIDMSTKIGATLQDLKRRGALYCGKCKSREIVFDPMKE